MDNTNETAAFTRQDETEYGEQETTEEPVPTRQQDNTEYGDEVKSDTYSADYEIHENQDRYNGENDSQERKAEGGEQNSVYEPKVSDNEEHRTESVNETDDDRSSRKEDRRNSYEEQQRYSEPTKYREDETNGEKQTPKETGNEQSKNQSKQNKNNDNRKNNNEKEKTTKKKRAVSASPSMSSLRSSVRPKSSKQPWGTIMQPEFGLGYQKMTEYEIAQTVDRLYKIPTPKERVYERPGKKLNEEEYEEMMQRMTKIDKDKIPDSDRRVQSSVYNRMGVVSSYAWKGYN